MKRTLSHIFFSFLQFAVQLKTGILKLFFRRLLIEAPFLKSKWAINIFLKFIFYFCFWIFDLQQNLNQHSTKKSKQAFFIFLFFFQFIFQTNCLAACQDYKFQPIYLIAFFECGDYFQPKIDT